MSLVVICCRELIRRRGGVPVNVMWQLAPAKESKVTFAGANCVW